MTRVAQAGDRATCSTPALQRKAIAQIFIRCSLRWPDRKASRRALKLDFLCLPTKVLEKLPAITAGLSFSIRKTGGSRLTYLKPGNTRRRRIISLALTTLTVSNSRLAGI